MVDYVFKKCKTKIHKKLENDMSFVECTLKHNEFDILCKYSTDLNIMASNYNIINACVEYRCCLI